MGKPRDVIQFSFLFSLMICCVCRVPVLAQETRWIDDIIFDSTIDNPDFKICNTEEQIIQYFNDGKGVQFTGGKLARDAVFFSTYKKVATDESGLIRIRFIVNCKGELGRFRLLSSDFNYSPFQFSNEITDQLVDITSSMKGWQPKIWKGMNVDYYQYLIFKIDKGVLMQILP